MAPSWLRSCGDFQSPLLTALCLLVIYRELACKGSSAASCSPDVEAWLAMEEVGGWGHPPISSAEDKWFNGPLETLQAVAGLGAFLEPP